MQIKITLRFGKGPDHDYIWLVLAVLSANQYLQVILATKPLTLF